MDSVFKDWNVIITGGTRGIGFATAEAFSDAGAFVTCIYRSDETAAAAAMLKLGPGAEVVRTDVSDYGQVEEFYARFNAKHDSLHVLVNNAGIRKDAVVGMMPYDDWSKVINTNLTGTYNMCKFAVHKMMENKFGRIVNLSSPSGKLGLPGQANYAASKAGQVAFTKSLAKEVARRGITVNCISPGFTETEFISDISDDLRKTYLGQVPMRRFARPEEIAAGILFLASKNASYITGAVLDMDGGLT